MKKLFDSLPFLAVAIVVTAALRLGYVALAQLPIPIGTPPIAGSASVGGLGFATYQEGTWTPVITAATNGGTITFTSQNGGYVKIGKMVFCTMSVQVSGLGTASGALGLSGLPFTVDTGGAGNIFWNSYGTTWSNTVTAFIGIGVFPLINTTTANLAAYTAASTSTFGSPQVTDISATFLLRGTFAYKSLN